MTEKTTYLEIKKNLILAIEEYLNYLCIFIYEYAYDMGHCMYIKK